MSERTIKTRIINKHAIESDWLKATNFTPLNGEIIIYDGDNINTPRIKIGNGIDNVNDLSFIIPSSVSDLINDADYVTANDVAVKNVFEVSVTHGESYLHAIHETVGDTTLYINDLAIVTVITENCVNAYSFKIVYKYNGTEWAPITAIPDVKYRAKDPNLFDINNVLVGYEVYGGKTDRYSYGDFVRNASSAITGYCLLPTDSTVVNITGLPVYTFNGYVRYYWFYDENKNALAPPTRGDWYIQDTTISNHTITIPEGARYFAISIYQRTTEHTDLSCAANLSITTDIVDINEAYITSIDNMPIVAEIVSEETETEIKIYEIGAVNTNLNTNTIYTHEVSSSDKSIVYNFNSPDNTSIQNQILIYLKTNAATSVTWNGNIAFVGDSIANIAIGTYRIIAEWNPVYVNSDNTKGAWIIGVIQDGAEGGIS